MHSKYLIQANKI